MPFTIIRNDITKMEVDAIVNTAYDLPTYGTGTDYAVYKAAGEKELLACREQIGRKKEGDVFITPGFKLPAKYIIHAVSPLWIDGKQGETELLSKCYKDALKLAKDIGCESIAFPLISAGGFGFPKEIAFDIATSEIKAFLSDDEDMDVTLVVFGDAVVRLSSRLFDSIESFIDSHYVEEAEAKEYGDVYERRRSLFEDDRSYIPGRYLDALPEVDEADEDIIDESTEAEPHILFAASMAPAPKRSLDDLINNSAETFQQMLFRLIDERGLKDSEVYHRANVSRKHFSKIRNNIDYNPKKQTVFAFAISLKLNIDETKDLLNKAGYSLSPSSKFDLIFQYFIENEDYDMFTINEVLFDYGLDTIGV